jgi:prevent-host-death family protein
MVSVGVRELRQDASRWLARVRAGESIVVTDRGRPVARMIPFDDVHGYEALLEQGRIAPGTGLPLEEMLTALDSQFPPEEGPELGEALRELRSDER